MKILSRLSRTAGLASGMVILSIPFLAILAPRKVNAAEWENQQAAPLAKEDWVIQSNGYSEMLLNIQLEHSPENGSQEGLRKFDTRIGNPRRADDVAARRELEAVLGRLNTAYSRVTDTRVREDLDILRLAFALQFRVDDFAERHLVTAYSASELIFQGIKILLDDQVAADRYPAALIRLKKYVGDEPGLTSFTTLLRQRVSEQLRKPGIFYPPRNLLTDQLERNHQFVDAIPMLFRKYNLHGWESAYAKLKVQLRDYDAWVASVILPKARSDFRQPPEQYALSLEQSGVDIAPDQVASMAHAAFIRDQTEIAALAVQVAKTHGFQSDSYADVIRELKKSQIVGEAILPLYQGRLREIERIIQEQHLVTLPNRPAIIRLATAAETAQSPAPHSTEPPLIHNTGQSSEFVLPLNYPSSTVGPDHYDDFTFDASSWPLTAHEARPGHQLQFDSMLEQGVSIARVRFASNPTNEEGWALYSEFLIQPFEPLDGQLITLQYRLLRDARAFLDPELQSGKITLAEAMAVLENEVVLSHALASEEIERYTIQNPGQAVSYFYGYTLMRSLRDETEKALGRKFDQKSFHDFVIAQGEIPMKLIRQAVMTEFIPAQQ